MSPLRLEGLSGVGREHLSYRSSFGPVRGVVDGDLCAEFLTLPHSRQREVVHDLGLSLSQACELLQALKHRALEPGSA